MKQHPLETLLDRLTQGDSAAAERVFLAYEPYLRMVVRRQLSRRLRAKFDSTDVVQSVWADLVQGFRDQRWSFADANQLRGFLVRVTRNRLIDRLRQCTPAIEHERLYPAADLEAVAESRTPRPSQVAQADELWQQMLAACAPAHRTLLELKRQGCALDEIAVRTGYHKSTVRRILYDLAQRFGAHRRT